MTDEPLVYYKGAWRKHDFIIRTGHHDPMECTHCKEQELSGSYRRTIFGRWKQVG